MKKIAHSIIPALLLTSILLCNLVSVQATEISPRYTGITVLTASVDVSSAGKATSNGKVMLRDGYTVDLTVELKQDGSTIKTWTTSGSGIVTAGGTYYVKSGHTYTTTTTATVYDADGNVVESPSKTSPGKDY